MRPGDEKTYLYGHYRRVWDRQGRKGPDSDQAPSKRRSGLSGVISGAFGAGWEISHGNIELCG